MKKILIAVFAALALSACGQQVEHTGYPYSMGAARPPVAQAPMAACENCCVVKMKDGRGACVVVENGKVVGKGKGCTNATKMCDMKAKKAGKKAGKKAEGK